MRLTNSLTHFITISVILVFTETVFSEVSYTKDILPILKKNCFKCHQKPYKSERGKLKKPKSGLRLDDPKMILKGNGDEKAGFLWLEHPNNNPKEIEIIMIYISKEYRRQGLARVGIEKLLREVDQGTKILARCKKKSNWMVELLKKLKFNIDHVDKKGTVHLSFQC